ncbi:MAG: acetyl-CoA carboxylase biotin carboxyl carrier protein [Planctomycetota bacterium]|nr:acetyl-CoA carboxylase biotin carboxyl carrier protein [Planctomycetota bacterium]
MSMDNQMDLKLIRNLVRLMERGELSELEIDDQKAGMRLHLKRGVKSDSLGPVMMVPPGASMAPMQDAAGAAPVPVAPSTEEGGRPAGVIEITSPMVGTFYRASGPDEDPFTSVGTRIDDESVVCIIEAMKVMNEIKAECAGEIVEILVENGEPVEFGQPLFLVKRA